MKDFWFKAKVWLWWMRDAHENYMSEVGRRDLDEYYCCSSKGEFGRTDCCCGGDSVRGMWSGIARIPE